MISFFRRARPATFVLTSQLVGVMGEGEGKQPNYVFQELPEGTLGPSNPSELSRYDLHDRAAFLSTLQDVLKEAKIGAKRAHLALDGSLLRQLNLPLPFIPPPDELRLAVQTEAERYVMFGGTEIGLDFGLLRQEPESLALLFAACRSDLLTGIVECFAECGIEVSSIEPFSMALVRGLSLDYPDLFTPTEDVHGVIAVLPHKLEVSYWQNQQIVHWRHIYLDTQALVLGELSALTEAQLELQRTLRDQPSQAWLLLDVPEKLDSFLLQRFNLNVVQRLSEPAEIWKLVARGAEAYAPDAFPFALNLQVRREEPPRTISRQQIVLLGIFSAILLVSLLVNAFLGMHAHGIANSIARVQRETDAMMSTVRKTGASGEGQQLAVDVLSKAAGMSDLFNHIREVTPQEVWITETQVETLKQVSINGMSLSRSAPLAFAQELNRFPRLADVTVSELTLEDRQGFPLYRFRITAALLTKEKAR